MSAPPVTIRPAQTSDLEAMGGLLDELFSLEADFVPDRAKQRKGLELLLGRKGARVLAAQAGDQLVGMCSGQVVISTAEGGPAVLVEDVVVGKNWRGQGVGAGLLKSLAQWAREQGAARLQLLADRGNQPALAFYQRLGWLRTNLICLRHREA